MRTILRRLFIRQLQELIWNDSFIDDIPEDAFRNGSSQSTQWKPDIFFLMLSSMIYAVTCTCKSWLRDARQWVDSASKGKCHSEELKGQSRNDSSFLVGCHGTKNEKLQWKISTSLTERRLMFSLTIVQIRYYVLIQIIIKSQNLD